MGNERIKLTAETILDKKFTPNVKGYDPEEVDEFLDIIISDYQAFKRFQEESRRYTEMLEIDNSKIKEEKKNLELENGRMRSRLDGIKEGTSVTSENIEMLQRIKKLEEFLYSKGWDPKKIR